METEKRPAPDAPRGGCDRAKKTIARAGDGRLGAIHLFALRRHLKSCPACEASFKRMLALLDALDGTARVGAPGGFAEDVLASLLAGTAPATEAPEQPGGRRGLLWVAGAAVLGIGVAVGVAAGMRFRGHASRTGNVEDGLAAGSAAV